jgi:hypothetical protein
VQSEGEEEAAAGAEGEGASSDEEQGSMLGSILRSAQKVLSRGGKRGGEGDEASEPGGWWGRVRLLSGAALWHAAP